MGELISTANENKIVTFGKRYYRELLIVFLIIVCVFSCNNPNSGGLVLTNIVSKENTLKSEDTIKKLGLEIKDSKTTLESLKKKEKSVVSYIKDLENEANKKSIAIADLDKQKAKIDAQIKQYKTNNIYYFFTKRYPVKNAVSTLPNAVVLMDTVSKKVITDLVDYDVTKQKLKISNNTIGLKDSIINSKDTIIKFKDLMIVEHKKISDKKDAIIVEKDNIIFNDNTIIKNSEQIIKKEQKATQKEKNKKTFLGVAITALIGVLTYAVLTKPLFVCWYFFIISKYHLQIFLRLIHT